MCYSFLVCFRSSAFVTFHESHYRIACRVALVYIWSGFESVVMVPLIVFVCEVKWSAVWLLPPFPTTLLGSPYMFVFFPFPQWRGIRVRESLCCSIWWRGFVQSIYTLFKNRQTVGECFFFGCCCCWCSIFGSFRPSSHCLLCTWTDVALSGSVDQAMCPSTQNNSFKWCLLRSYRDIEVHRWHSLCLCSLIS